MAHTTPALQPPPLQPPALPPHALPHQGKWPRLHPPASPQPLMPGQDPSVVYRNGIFHLVQSENGERGITGIFLYQSTTLAGLRHAPRQCIWRAPRSGPLSRNLWAPELVWVDGFAEDRGQGSGRWYIYFAADDGRNENHRMYALQSHSPDPAGPYLLKGKLAAPNADRWAIDGALIDVEEPLGGGRKLYFVWSGWEGQHNGMQRLYIAPMSDPWTLSGERIEISRPDAPWERRSGPHPCYVNEGPAVAVRAGKVILAFSANGFWSDHYCVGLLSCNIENLLDPAAWTKSDAPAFSATDHLFGPGHNCFVHADNDSPDAGWWIVYHAVRHPNRHGKGRELFAQPFHWTHPLPTLGRPGQPTPAPLPTFTN